MRNVLVVDDVAENVYFLESLLKGNGFAVRTALNGAEALETARHDPPDLIVSDILMPVMDGYALCRAWRTDERLKHIPFIFYTATFTDQKDEALALSMGADRFVIKPQEPEALMGIIRETASSCSTKSGASAGVPEMEGEVLREYNEVLFRKLEKKMADLEQVNQELKQSLNEQKRLESQLRQGQKMNAIGRFSAGIAHDFGNILTVIFNFGVLMQMKMTKEDPQREMLDRILAAAERAKTLTQSLLTFSRKQEMKLEKVNLNDCIRNIEFFLRRVIGEDVILRTSFTEEDISIVGDPGHIEQVLMNLAANARDAMPGGGTLTIGTGIMEIDELFIQMHGYGTQGRHAVLTVADNGAGMDDETREQMFDPFFTTKEAGQGTGLGLSIIYGIVSQHKGHIIAHSEPGQGTTFKILLPLMSRDTIRRHAQSCHQPLRGGEETILIVDDEAATREYLDVFLTSIGYRVLVAGDGQEAINLFRKSPEKIDMVLMDVIMPIKKGNEAAFEMRCIRSDLPIIFTSGFQYDLIRDRKLLEDGEQLLMKPLVPTEVAATLRAALDGTADI